MKVPYQLHWLPTSAPANALLLPGHHAVDVLRVCVEVGADPLPRIHAVADGFLLLLSKSSEQQMVGVVRLRGLSNHLLIPVDAELAPALLPDEAAALVSKRGLVFQPNGRVLEFDPAKPIPLSALAKLDLGPRRSWAPFPERPVLASNITEVTRVGVDTSVDLIIEQGGAGIGTDDPSLESGDLPSQLAGNTLYQLGKSIAWLGQKMNSPSLAGLGAKLLDGALSLHPSLSEKLMGAQEAMLRELLKQFREGNIEQALKHALPLGADPSRGMTVAPNAKLPTHNLYYSLVNLLGTGGGGPASVWFTPDQTYHELLKEYRKQAELATNKGDYRRAAFIYAKLLNEYHSAARVLAQGGLHADAAILYEKKLTDLASAAREWEAAGEIDRAINLHRKLGDHATAGDLLRRIGEEERAVQEYQIAAGKMIATGSRHYEAGELLRVRGRRPDLAVDYYNQGWQLRPAGAALTCATRLVQHHADTADQEPFLAVLTEAEDYLSSQDPESTATFFTEIARLSRSPKLKPIADELHDRALTGIARKMNQHVGTSPIYARSLSNLLKDPAVWPVPLVGDAQHALNDASRRPLPARPTYQSVQLRHGDVTAVCQMPPGNEVFIGFASGDVVLFEPARHAVHPVTRETGAILSMVAAIAAGKSHVVILSQAGADRVCLRALGRDIGFRSCAYHHELVASARLAQPALNNLGNVALLYHGNACRYFALPNLVSSETSELCQFEDNLLAVVHGQPAGAQPVRWVLPIVNDQLFTDRHAVKPISIGWRLDCHDDSTLAQLPLHAILPDHQTLELTGLGTHGILCHSTLRLAKLDVETIRFHATGKEGYRAFARVRSDLFAGITTQGIDWWTPGRIRAAQTKLPFKNPVAAFPLPAARELLVVDADGLLTRVPIAE